MTLSLACHETAATAAADHFFRDPMPGGMSDAMTELTQGL